MTGAANLWAVAQVAEVQVVTAVPPLSRGICTGLVVSGGPGRGIRFDEGQQIGGHRFQMRSSRWCPVDRAVVSHEVRRWSARRPRAETLGERGVDRCSGQVVADGEDDVVEVLDRVQGLGERVGHDRGVVAEHPAPPRTEHEAAMPVRRGDLEDPPGPPGEYGWYVAGVVRLAAYDRPEVGRGCGQQRGGVRLVEQVAMVVAEHRHVGGVDEPVAVAQVPLGAVEGVELGRGPQTCVQG